jgi:thiosulfate/3-mercaptopyruvate sulfurtransferase
VARFLATVLVALSLTVLASGAHACAPATVATARILPVAASADTTGSLETAPCNRMAVIADTQDIAAQVLQGAVQVLDIRHEARRRDGVLPNSVAISFDLFRGVGRSDSHDAALAALSGAVGLAGLQMDEPIVIVAQTDRTADLARAAYAYWVLKSLGAPEIAILQGGYTAWQEAGGPVFETAFQATPYAPHLTFSDAFRADHAQVYAVGMMMDDGRLLDVRDCRDVKRLDVRGRAVATTLPGAMNAPATDLTKVLQTGADLGAVSVAVRDHLAAHRAMNVPGPVISFSASGELAALYWFLGHEVAGIDTMRVYADGLHGWKAANGQLFRAANAF